MRGARLYGAYRPASPKLVWAIPDINANSLVQVPPPQTCTTSGPCARVRPSGWNSLRLHSGNVHIFNIAGSNVLSSSTATMSGCSCAIFGALPAAQSLALQAGGLSAADCVHNIFGSTSAVGDGILIWVW